MERIKHKSKKEKPIKYVDKDKATSFITDIKTIKENLKIREILRTVKMNSSMRIKAPRGSKVMQNKDFNDNGDFFDETTSNEESETSEHPSAMNPDVVINNSSIEEDETVLDQVHTNDPLNSSNFEEVINDIGNIDLEENSVPKPDRDSLRKTNSLSESSTDDVETDTDSISAALFPPEIIVPESPVDNSHTRTRDRKLSLDHTLLSRREGFSQSELDLHSIGKSPLERKSSFFRKKMDSFFKNTTEIFKRQSFQSNTQCPKRRESMSVSLQSLNEKIPCNSVSYQEVLQGSVTSLQSSAMAERSASSLSISQSDLLHPDVQSEEDSIVGSQHFDVVPSSSVHSLNEAYVQEGHLNRAISMNSGLDSAHVQGRRKASRSNRVTWMASESLTNYFRRVIQDEKSRNMQGCHSYQDFSTIPEDNLYGIKTDSKGRRLSYQRAVSGEDPVTSTRYQDSSLRRRPLISENSEAHHALSEKLAEFTKNGVPPLKGFNIAEISGEAFASLIWIKKLNDPTEIYGDLDPKETERQAVIRELILTEASYIRHLITVVEVFIAAAHALQDDDKLMLLNTQQLFINIPDILNANLQFWELTIYPMLKDSFENGVPFNTDLMIKGFLHFHEIFHPYEKYFTEQPHAIVYMRHLSNDAEFMVYLNWCHSHESCNRLQLSDILVKPMQRLTKYNLILQRLIDMSDMEPQRSNLIAMDNLAKQYVLDVNRMIRQRYELAVLDELSDVIDLYDLEYITQEFKDPELIRAFRLFATFTLKSPMVNCDPSYSRCLIHHGEIHYKDKFKEFDAMAILFTDLMFISKVYFKGGKAHYKVIRSKLMVNKLALVPPLRGDENKLSLTFVVLDEYISSNSVFIMSQAVKHNTDPMTVWKAKIREARMTYDLTVWSTLHPLEDLNNMKLDITSIYGISKSCAGILGIKPTPEDAIIERQARDRVSVMLHRSTTTTPVEWDNSAIPYTLSDPVKEEEPITDVDSKEKEKKDIRQILKRDFTGDIPRSPRYFSFQESLSGTSKEEPQYGLSGINKPTLSVEHQITTLKPDEDSTPIIVSVVKEAECETAVSAEQPIAVHAPTNVVLHQPAPRRRTVRSSSRSRNTLRVEPLSETYGLMYSLPDLTRAPSPKLKQSATTQSAAEQLYKSHQELLQRKRQTVGPPKFLAPVHGGANLPPSSPTRSSLKRSLVNVIKNPPLLKLGQAYQTVAVADPGTSTVQVFKIEKSRSTAGDSKGDKKGRLSRNRNKKTGGAPPASRMTEDAMEYDRYEPDISPE